MDGQQVSRAALVALVRGGLPLLLVAAVLDGSFAFFVVVVQAFLPDTLAAGAAAPGFALGIYGFTRVAVQLPGGILARRIGARRLVALGLAAGAVSVLAMAATTGAGQVYALTVSYGVGTALAWPAVYLLAGDQTRDERGALLGMVTICALAGLGTGLVLGALLVDTLPARTLLPIIAVLLAIGAAAPTIGAAGRRRTAERLLAPASDCPLPAVRLRLVALLPVIAFQGLGLSMLLPVLRQYAQEQLGLQLRDLILLAAPAGLVGAAVFIPAGRLADRLGRPPLMAAGFALAAAGVIILARAESGLPFALGAIPLAAGYAAAAPAFGAAISDLTDRSGRGVGVALTVQGIAIAAGPVLAGVLIAGSGPALPLTVAAVMWLAAALAALVPLWPRSGHTAPQPDEGSVTLASGSSESPGG